MPQDIDKKFALTDDTRAMEDGTVVHRIIALRDFGKDVPFGARAVKRGERGGFVQSEKNLSHSGVAWVADDACISGDANVSGDALVKRNAHVSGSAQVRDSAIIDGRAIVDNTSIIQGRARITGDAQVSDVIVEDGLIMGKLASSINLGARRHTDRYAKPGRRNVDEGTERGIV